MVPGFVLLGTFAVLFQLLVIGGFYGYLRYRRPVADRAVRRRVDAVLAGGAGLAAFGQLAGFVVLWSPLPTPMLSFGEAVLVQRAGLLVVFVGYLGVLAGVVVHWGTRRTQQRT